MNVRLCGVLCAVWFLGCEAPEVVPPPAGLKLSAVTQDSLFETQLPARVSVFFSVDATSGDPIAPLTVDNFKIYEDGNPISQWESDRTIESKHQRYRMRSVLLLDLSGSVLKSGQFPALRDAATRYIRDVLGATGTQTQISLMTFDGRDKPEVVVPFTSDHAALAAGLTSLETVECHTRNDCAGFADRKTCAAWRCVDDSTNLNGAALAALEALDKALVADTDVQFKDGALVVFTDGTDQAARVAVDVAQKRILQSTSHVFSVGLGAEIDRAALRMVGKDGSFLAGTGAELSDAFAQVADRVRRLAGRYYLLQYCSPKRAGHHRLKIEAIAPGAAGLTGSLTGEFDATGFSSGCALQP